MGFTTVGSLVISSQNTVSINPTAIGNIFVLFTIVWNGVSNPGTVNSVTGGNCSWTQLGNRFANTVHGYPVQAGFQIWLGVATATGSATVTASPSDAGGYIYAQQFSVGGATVQIDGAVAGVDYASPGGTTMPSLTPSQAGDLYIGFDFAQNSISAGSTPGFTYDVDNTNINGVVFNTNCGTGAQAPTWGSATMGAGVAVLLQIVSFVTPVAVSAFQPSPAWKARFAPNFRPSVLTDVQLANAGSFVTSGDITFGANTAGIQVISVTDPAISKPGPAWENYFRAYLGKQNVLYDVQRVFGSQPQAQITFGAITSAIAVVLAGDPPAALPGPAFFNQFRYSVLGKKAVIWDVQFSSSGSFLNPTFNDITFGATATGFASFAGIPGYPQLVFSPAFQNYFKGQLKKQSVLYDNPPDIQEIPFGPFCLGGTEVETNLYGGTATDPNVGMGGSEVDANLYGGSMTGCHV